MLEKIQQIKAEMEQLHAQSLEDAEAFASSIFPRKDYLN